jgi:two-component system response regulator DesR
MTVHTPPRDDDETSRPDPPETTGRRKLSATRTGPVTDPPASGPRDVKVLIVEDSAIVRERLVAMIGAMSRTLIIRQAGDGYQARELFQQDRPDAVILDIELPGINGMELLAQFKRAHPSCVVMVLTTYAFSEFRRRCAKLGADHFFDKASEFERLGDVLSDLQRLAAQEQVR